MEMEIIMFKMWAKTFHNTHMIKETVITDDRDETRTHKVFDSIDKVCEKFELSRPIWLNKNIEDFKRFSKVRFDQDSFIDTIDFDYLEIQMLEED